VPKLLAFVLPLGLDSFAVAAAIGAMQVTTVWQRLRISLVFVIFEGGMPLLGLGLGPALARGIGQTAGYLAGAAVIAIGAWMLFADDEDEEEKAGRIPDDENQRDTMSQVSAPSAAKCLMTSPPGTVRQLLLWGRASTILVVRVTCVLGTKLVPFG
jgi:putative Mn2+ efflux pump MntP